MTINVYRSDEPHRPSADELNRLNKQLGIYHADYENLRSVANTPTVDFPRFNLAPFFEGQAVWAKVRTPDGEVVLGNGGTHFFFRAGSRDLMLAEEILGLAKTRGSGFAFEAAPLSPEIFRARVEPRPGVSGWVYGFVRWSADPGLPAPDGIRVEVPPQAELVMVGDDFKLSWPPYNGRADVRHSTAAEVYELALRGVDSFKLANGAPTFD